VKFRRKHSSQSESLYFYNQVAHRLSTIRDANKILVVGAGEIIEQGTHNSLLELEGSYYGMVQAQKLQQEAEKAAVEEDSDSDDAATSQASEVKRVQSRRSEIVEKPILDRRSTRQSVASEVLAAKRAEEGETQENTKLYSLFYLGKRCYAINREGKWQYLLGFFASICSGAVYPALAVLFGKAINDFSLRGSELTSATNRNALWYFIVAILAAIAIWVQQVTLTAQAEHLTGKLRTLYFKAVSWLQKT
jgi:ATP-binding cassette subfamily B (MDR/TAP) protein 1